MDKRRLGALAALAAGLLLVFAVMGVAGAPAAASQGYIHLFGDTDPAQSPEARKWLSRGLEEAILAFLAQAKDGSFGLHAAVERRVRRRAARPETRSSHGRCRGRSR